MNHSACFATKYSPRSSELAPTPFVRSIGKHASTSESRADRVLV